MRFEARLFVFFTPFFLLVAVIYGFWSGWEAVGSVGLFLLAGLVAMIGFYLALVAKRIDPRPEDDPYGDIEQGAGELGVYPPFSWWPLLVGLSAAIVFAGLAVGWWLFDIGVALAVISLIGWVFEYSRGQHAH